MMRNDVSNSPQPTLQLVSKDTEPLYRLYFNRREEQKVAEEGKYTQYVADFVPEDGGVPAVNGFPPVWEQLEKLLQSEGVECVREIKVEYDGYVSEHKADFLYPDLPATGGMEVIYDTTTVDGAKAYMGKKVEAYDSSSNVNGFYINNMQVWLDKDTRVGLMNSINIEKSAGKETSTLWLDGQSITVDCNKAIEMLSALELYALSCYNRTAEHKVAINALQQVGDILAYDYTAGYPEKLYFTL